MEESLEFVHDGVSKKFREKQKLLFGQILSKMLVKGPQCYQPYTRAKKGLQHATTLCIINDMILGPRQWLGLEAVVGASGNIRAILESSNKWWGG